MGSALKEQLSGVGALIVVPRQPERGFITIEELKTSGRTNKLHGMRSLPMESSEPGETWEKTLSRLFEEELALERYHPLLKLCHCELVPGIVMHAYLVEIPSGTAISLGTSRLEVADPRWVSFREVLAEPEDSLRFRPGVFEVVTSYLDLYNQGEDYGIYQPRDFRYAELRHKIPPRLFNQAGFLSQDCPVPGHAVIVPSDSGR